ncbi:unnamed protein product [Citrullus colocynthis]|uniref:Uncharacterized protein n=1 Tax=Citrullus colocynthis TaxID=252529 RepID=A0ABP0YIQ9_9ROSI
MANTISSWSPIQKPIRRLLQKENPARPTRRRFQPGMLNADNPTDRPPLSLPVSRRAAAQSAIKADLAYLDRTIVEKHLKGNWILYCSLNSVYNVFDQMPLQI